MDNHLSELEFNIKKLFEDFFKDMNIDNKTGKVDGTSLRFSGYPYIGRNYVNSPIKILFIPLDTGEDERNYENTYHSINDRRNIIEGCGLSFNPHMAGTYATALYILKEKLGIQFSWDALWEYRENHKICTAIKKAENILPQDLLTYVAYENRFRFVTDGRGSEKKERQGGKDRIWVDAKREAQLLKDEIDLFSPDIIVFQGKDGLWNCGVEELKSKCKVVIAYHPSCYQYKADKLQYIVNNIAPQLII